MHIRLVARAREVERTPGRAEPSTASTSPIGVKIQFLVDLTDRVITIIMQKESTY
jgi:hypothetical protein